MIRSVLAMATVLASSCGPKGEPVEEGRFVTYQERTSDGYIVINLSPDDDCDLRILMGSSLNDLDLAGDAHCTADELAQGEALLNNEAWQTYPDVACPLLPDTEGPAADENGTPQSTANYPIGCIYVERLNFPGGAGRKHFDASTTGPEAEVIKYFHHLQKTYGIN